MINERDVQAALDANVDAGLMERTTDGHYRLTRKGEHHVEAMPNGGVWFFSALTELLREYERQLTSAMKADDLPALDGAALHVLLALYRTDMQRPFDLALATGWTATAFTPVFDRARVWLSVKAVQATRLDFEDAFDDLMSAAMSGSMSRRAWSTRLRSLVSVACNKAYRDGLVDGGQALNNALWAKLQELV